MSLILTSMALGLIPAWRGSLTGIIVSSWGVAGVIVTSMLFAQGTLVDVLPAVGLVVLGFNAGIVMGMGLNFAAGFRSAPSA